ncbi:MAG: hypothetical protein LBT50_03295 [Prevotellaceae bacterium]|jgi:hypothetical protein|nr:hypothetical protein [Prevotellaceae bacterium]
MNLYAGKYISLCLLLLSALFNCCNNPGNNFATRNIENITRIELSDKNNRIVLSKTEKEQWFVASFKANMRNIENLKKILSGVEVQYPLPKMYESDYSNKKIKDEGIRIDLFKGKDLEQSYYLLFTDDDDAGTIGLKAGKQQSFVMELPGQDIDFSDYIVVEQAFWENNVLFSFSQGQIKYLKVEDHENQDNSFSIENGDSISLFDVNGKNIPFDKSKMNTYLSYFNNISFDSNLNITDDEKQKIASTKPLYTMTIESEAERLTCHINPVSDNNSDDYGNPLVYNRDFFNLVIPEKKLFAKARWLEFDILFEELSYFYD